MKRMSPEPEEVIGFLGSSSKRMLAEPKVAEGRE